MKGNISEVYEFRFMCKFGEGVPAAENAKAVTAETAVKMFKSKRFAHASMVAWEHVRWQIARNAKHKRVWEDHFFRIQALITKDLSESKTANAMLSKLGVELDVFVASQPAFGAAAEIVSGAWDTDNNFFTRQLELCKCGVWVCGWEGDIDKNKFLYPMGVFYIYTGEL